MPLMSRGISKRRTTWLTAEELMAYPRPTSLLDGILFDMEGLELRAGGRRRLNRQLFR